MLTGTAVLAVVVTTGAVVTTSGAKRPASATPLPPGKHRHDQNG